MSTNFTIWAFIFSVAAVDVAHYTESVLICKPLILKIINQCSRMQKPAFAGFCVSLEIELISSSKLVPRRRLELPRPCGHQHLKLACLPISPSGQYRQRCPSSMARTIRSVFLTVNPQGQKNLENFASGLQNSFVVSIQGFRWVVLA